MNTANKSLGELTAEDLMDRDVVVLPEDTPLREAARLLLHNQIGGAPVVDAVGRCIGVLSSIDFVRLAECRANVARPAAPPLPITCSFQTKHRNLAGRDEILCTLAAGVCPMQVRHKQPDGAETLICTQPHSVFMDWQVVEVEKLPSDEVSRFMTPDPVMVHADASISTLARMMRDLHIHRLIVVDDGRQPIGAVSSGDLLTALAEDE